MAEWPASAVVCNCLEITRGALSAAGAAGCKSVDDLVARTGASTVCDSCRPRLAEFTGAGSAATAERWGSGLQVAASVAGVLALLIAAGEPAPPAASLRASGAWDVLYRVPWWRQATGFGVLALALIAMVGYSARRRFQPGRTTDGHHQIEIACDRCHTPFDGVRQEACLDCHAAELEAALDSHAASIFEDPRNAADLDRLDVRECITCHTEHQPALTGPMGVTLPSDFCDPCHATVAEDRPTHRGLSIDTCASAGCHNYHDNRALYEDFLVNRGVAGPDTIAGVLPPRETWVSWETAERAPLGAADADAPESSAGDPELIDAWAGSAHAAAGWRARTATSRRVRPGPTVRRSWPAPPATSSSRRVSSAADTACGWRSIWSRCRPRSRACRCTRARGRRSWPAGRATTPTPSTCGARRSTAAWRVTSTSTRPRTPSRPMPGSGPWRCLGTRRRAAA